MLLVQRDGDLAGTGDTLPGVVRLRVEQLVNRVPDRLARLDHADVDRGAGAGVEDRRPAREALDVVAQLLRVVGVAGTGEVAELERDVRRDRPVVRRGDAVGLLDPRRHVAEREGVIVERDAQGRRGVACRPGVAGGEVRTGSRCDRGCDEQGSDDSHTDESALASALVLEHGLERHSCLSFCDRSRAGWIVQVLTPQRGCVRDTVRYLTGFYILCQHFFNILSSFYYKIVS